jgi:hypothetical protein
MPEEEIIKKKRTVSPNFHGVKGKSGRKSIKEEFSKLSAINKAWIRVDKHIDTLDVDKIALPIVLKDMTQKQDINANIAIQPITGMQITIDNSSS